MQWDEIVSEPSLTKIAHKSIPDDIISLVFTSGTTGNPKGVIQTHESNIIPVQRFIIDSVGFSNEDTLFFISTLGTYRRATNCRVFFSTVVWRNIFNESIDTWQGTYQSVDRMFWPSSNMGTVAASDYWKIWRARSI